LRGAPRDETGGSCSSLDFAAAHLQVCPGRPSSCPWTFHRVDNQSFERLSVPSCASTSPFPTLPSLPPTGACGRRQMPLLGFPKIAPPSYAAEESTPAATRVAASRWAEPPPICVPSSRFSTALTAFSSPTLHVCCTVLPTMGFLTFRWPRGHLLTRRSCPSKFSPRSWRSSLATLERTDASSPLPFRRVHRAPCLLTLHPTVDHCW